MPIDVTVQRRITAASDQVTAIAFDWRHDHEWTQGIRHAELTTPAPGGGLGEGAEVRRTAYFLGKRIDYTLRVDSLDAQQMVMTSVAGPFPMRVTYRFRPDGDATVASIRVEGGRGLMGRIGGPMVRRNLRKDLRDLERLVA